MLAALLKSPGNLTMEEIPSPEPGPGEVVLRVEACALCGTDKRVLTGEKPVSVPIIGHEIAGVIAAAGKGVSPELQKGTRYAVQTVIGCGECPMCKVHQENLCEKGFTAIGYAYNGGFAEYLKMPANSVAQGCLIPIPSSMPAEIGTLLEPLSCGINGLRYIPLEGMDHVGIVGAGVIGVLNGLIAKARGAKKVTIFNRSSAKLDVIKKLGLPFDNLVDYSKTDAAKWISQQTGGRGLDAVVLSASEKDLIPMSMPWLARGGHMSLFAGLPKSDPVAPIDLNVIHYKELHLHGANSSVRRDYEEALRMLTDGRIDGRALITHRFPLRDFAEAVRTQNDPKSGALKVIVLPESR